MRVESSSLPTTPFSERSTLVPLAPDHLRSAHPNPFSPRAETTSLAAGLEAAWQGAQSSMAPIVDVSELAARMSTRWSPDALADRAEHMEARYREGRLGFERSARFSSGVVAEGNRHPIGSDAWFEEGVQTGLWFGLDPSAFDAMMNEAGARFARRSDYEQMAQFTLLFAKQLARLSDRLTRAQRAGATLAELRVLAEAALTRGSLGEGKRSDFDAVWSGDNERAKLGNVYSGRIVFGDSTSIWQGNGARHQIARMGAEAIETVDRKAQELGIELFDGDQTRREAIHGAISDFVRAHRMDLVRLAQSDPEAYARFQAARERLELDALADDDAPSRP